MKDRKIWELFHLLTDKEKERLYFWLKSELLDTQKEVVQLYEILRRYNQTSDVPEWKEIWGLVSPEKRDDERAFRKTATLLGNQITAYLSIAQFRSEPYLMDTMTLKSLRMRSASPGLFIKTFRKLRNATGKALWKDNSYYRAMYEQETEFSIYAQTHRIKGIGLRLKELTYSFDRWWMYEKIRLAPTLQNETLTSKPQNLLLGEIEQVIPEMEDYHSWREMHINQEVKDLLSGKSENADQLFMQIQSLSDIIPRGQLHDFFGLITNHYTRQVNNGGGEKIIRAYLSVLDWGIEKKIIFDGGHINSSHFLNLIQLSLKIGDIKRAESYFRDLYPYLFETEKKPIVRYSRCLIDFQMGKFEKVSRELAQLRLNAPSRDCQAKMLLWQSGYEIARKENTLQQEKKYLIAQADTIIAYIKGRNDMSNKVKKYFLNFIRMLRRLATASTENRLRSLLNEVNQFQPGNFQTWLREKIQERLSTDFGGGLG